MAEKKCRGRAGTLVIMMKAPRIGAVKRRLARQIGAVAAWRVYRAMAADLCRRLGADRRWTTIVSLTPDRASGLPQACRALPAVPQGRGDLGARMQRILDCAPPGPVLVIGSDIPAITPAHIARAFRALKRADVVFGPAADGGYWLVGARRVPRKPRLFEGVRWSHRQTLADTLKNARGLKVGLVDTLRDVDDLDVLRAWTRSSRTTGA